MPKAESGHSLWAPKNSPCPMAKGKTPDNAAIHAMRLDKWLWAARFYKTRSLAVEAIDKGHVCVNGHSAKKSTDVAVGASVQLKSGWSQRSVQVLALSAMRGPAPVAQALYQETEESIAQRAAQEEARRLAPEPAWQREQGRPTKRDRRQLQGMQQPEPQWNNRWSAQWDE